MMNPKHVLQNQKYSCLSMNYLELDLIKKFLEIYILIYSYKASQNNEARKQTNKDNNTFNFPIYVSD